MHRGNCLGGGTPCRRHVRDAPGLAHRTAVSNLRNEADRTRAVRPPLVKLLLFLIRNLHSLLLFQWGLSCQPCMEWSRRWVPREGDFGRREMLSPLFSAVLFSFSRASPSGGLLSGPGNRLDLRRGAGTDEPFGGLRSRSLPIFLATPGLHSECGRSVVFFRPKLDESFKA